MSRFKLPSSELLKLRRYKQKLLRAQGDVSDISHEGIAKRSGIRQILQTLQDIENPKKRVYGYEEFGGVRKPLYEKPKTFQDAINIATEYEGIKTTTPKKSTRLLRASLSSLLKRQDILKRKKDKTERDYGSLVEIKQQINNINNQIKDARKAGKEDSFSLLEGFPIPKERQITEKDVKSRDFLKEWGIEYNPDLDYGANIVAGRGQVWPHQREEYDRGANALFEKPKEIRKKVTDVFKERKVKRLFRDEGYEDFYNDDMDYGQNIVEHGKWIAERKGEAEADIWFEKAEGMFKKEPTKAQAMKEVSSIVNKITSDFTSLPLSDEISEDMMIQLQPYISRIKLLMPFVPEDQRENLEILFNLGEKTKTEENIPEGAEFTGKHFQGKKVYVLPNGQGWIPD